jgi:hypothetical protein
MLKRVEFTYPTIKIDDSDSQYLKIDNGSVVYWFSRNDDAYYYSACN